MSTAIPALTSKTVIQTVVDIINQRKFDNSETFDSNNPAPAASCTALLNGVTSFTLPSKQTWIQEYKKDPQTKLLFEMVENSSLITHDSMQQLHCACRNPAPCAGEASTNKWYGRSQSGECSRTALAMRSLTPSLMELCIYN